MNRGRVTNMASIFFVANETTSIVKDYRKEPS